MGILSLFLREKAKTSAVAKERLQFILAHERNGGSRLSAADMKALQAELIAVISKYVNVEPRDVKVEIERQDDLEVLQVKIELPEAGR